MKKEYLPQKIYPVCEKPFLWQKMGKNMEWNKTFLKTMQ